MVKNCRFTNSLQSDAQKENNPNAMYEVMGSG